MTHSNKVYVTNLDEISGGGANGGDTIQSFTFDMNENKLTITTDKETFSASINGLKNIEIEGSILSGSTIISGTLSIENGNFYMLQNSDSEYQTILETYRTDGSYRSVFNDRYTGKGNAGVEIAIFDTDNTQICAIGATNEMPYYDTKTGRLRILTENDLVDIQNQMDDLDERITNIEDNPIPIDGEFTVIDGKLIYIDPEGNQHEINLPDVKAGDTINSVSWDSSTNELKITTDLEEFTEPINSFSTLTMIGNPVYINNVNNSIKGKLISRGNSSGSEIGNLAMDETDQKLFLNYTSDDESKTFSKIGADNLGGFVLENDVEERIATKSEISNIDGQITDINKNVTNLDTRVTDIENDGSSGGGGGTGISKISWDEKENKLTFTMTDDTTKDVEINSFTNPMFLKDSSSISATADSSIVINQERGNFAVFGENRYAVFGVSNDDTSGSYAKNGAYIANQAQPISSGQATQKNGELSLGIDEDFGVFYSPYDDDLKHPISNASAILQEMQAQINQLQEKIKILEEK